MFNKKDVAKKSFMHSVSQEFFDNCLVFFIIATAAVSLMAATGLASVLLSDPQIPESSPRLGQ